MLHSVRWPRGRALALPALLALACVTSDAAARPPDDPNDPGGPPGGDRPVTVNGTVNGRLVVNPTLAELGVPVAFTGSGSIVGSMRGTSATFQLPATSWSFSLIAKPAASQATVQRSGATATLTGDVGGVYTVRATACSGGCDIQLDNIRVRAPARSYEMSVTVLSLVQPAMEPESPVAVSRGKQVDPDVTFKCTYGLVGGAAITNPQWVTSERFEGAQSYRLVEGRVSDSSISHTDNFLNHESHDWKIPVRPDPQFEELLQEGRNSSNIPVEWESDHLPAMFRPLKGDRVSAYGFHIYDCGHGMHAEIHPPVLLAVHRARAVHIPSDARLDLRGDGTADDSVGSNVWVPGIISDVLVNREAGEATECGATHVRQPASKACLLLLASKPEAIQAGACRGDCMPDPAPIRRTYTYTIHLPPNPGKLARARGIANAPDVPLYVAMEPLPGYPAAPVPTFTPRYQVGTDPTNGITYLEVKVDLGSFTGSAWAHRIVAAWVYPDATNFGIERWQVSTHSVTPIDDADPIWWDDGDWRMFAGTNAVSSLDRTSTEWARIISGSAYENETIQYGDDAWDETATAPGGRFFGDVVVFPNQPILYSLHGYDDDPFDGDKLGGINALLTQHSSGSRLVVSPSGHYSARWGIAAGAVIPRATLSSAARALQSRFLSTAPSVRQDVIAANAVLAELQQHLANPPPPPARATRGMLGEISDAELASKVHELQATDPATADVLLAEIRRQIDRKVPSAKKPAFKPRVESLKAEVPATVWTKHFGDLQ